MNWLLRLIKNMSQFANELTIKYKIQELKSSFIYQIVMIFKLIEKDKQRNETFRILGNFFYFVVIYLLSLCNLNNMAGTCENFTLHYLPVNKPARF